MGKIIGIDLGTTNCCVAVIEGGEAVVLPNPEGSRTTPSIVAFNDEDTFVGQQAKRQAIINPKRTVYDVKRLIGKKYRDADVVEFRKISPFDVVEATNGDAWVMVAGQRYSPQELSAIILRKMKQTAEEYFGEEITEAVITVPAYFDDAQRTATKEAGRIAGLTVRRIVNEPTAAALSFGYSRDVDKHLVVFDLGGGTFDVSILRMMGGVFEVVATSGDNNLGGSDFDRALLNHLLEVFEDQSGINLVNDKMALQRLRESAESAKCELSTLTETNINLPFLAVGEEGPQHLSLTLKRSTLEDLVYPLVERLEAPCRRAMEDAGLTNDDIGDVLLVGGMSRMPIVQREVEALFGRKGQKGVNPDEVVANGAAIQSGILGGEVREVILLDVTPFNMGVQTQGDGVSTIIERNTSIPARGSKVFTTTEDDQTMVTIEVLQGNSPQASKNKRLGVVVLEGLAPAPRRTPRIEVHFEIDTDGILTVAAINQKTGDKESVRLEGYSGLSEEELQRAIKRQQ